MVVIEENIQFHNNRYVIRLQRSFKTLQDAQEYKEKLQNAGLLKKSTPAGRPFKKYEDRYIQKNIHLSCISYTIKKKLNGKEEIFGTYRNLQDAREERDFLESIDWDYSNMDTVESLEYQENKEKWRRAINE